MCCELIAPFFSYIFFVLVFLEEHSDQQEGWESDETIEKGKIIGRKLNSCVIHSAVVSVVTQDPKNLYSLPKIKKKGEKKIDGRSFGYRERSPRTSGIFCIMHDVRVAQTQLVWRTIVKNRMEELSSVTLLAPGRSRGHEYEGFLVYMEDVGTIIMLARAQKGFRLSGILFLYFQFHIIVIIVP